MTDPSNLVQIDRGQAAQLIHMVDTQGFPDWLTAQSARTRTAIAAQRFTPKINNFAIIPGELADDWSVVAAVGDTQKLTVWSLARLADGLPEGTYRLDSGDPAMAAIGWILGQYRFDRYTKSRSEFGPRILLSPTPAALPDAIRIAEATALVRDLVNTPAADMGPAALEQVADDLAKSHSATFRVTRGAELEAGFPMIFAVGQAADRAHAPRLIELEWGHPANPRVAIIGKGITFDSGGLNIKPGTSMRLMKKDMGGAAHAIALASLIMQARLPVRLHLLIAAAENAIAGNAFRPGDILQSRAGLTVEIDNTDAEGRLVLADAITRAGEDDPVLMIDFATLTGAARVALGPDLPALFCNNDDLAREFDASSKAVDDPCWRMPLWAGYDDMLSSDIADCANSAEGGFAGAITAALFLQKFVNDAVSWAHFDTFAWRPAAKPGRPKGGDALGLRAAYHMLKTKFPPI
ncbi:MAG: leucyl aminopeptidase family protein [Sphingomonadaceae bacterium]